MFYFRNPNQIVQVYYNFNFFASFVFPAIHILRAKGKDGPVDLKVKLAGYNQAVLDLHGITDAVRYMKLAVLF